MEILFYTMNKDMRYVDKTDALSSATHINVKLKKKPNNLKNFNLELEMDVDTFTFNYCYIPKFNRWYFVGEPTSIYNDIMQVPLTCDLLYTYKDKILNSTQIVERSSSNGNAYLVDNEIATLAYDTIECYKFPKAINNDSIILITVG